MPVTKSHAIGMFLLEERNWDRWRLELGGRGEYAAQNPENTLPSRSFGLYNASAGVLWKFKEGYGLGLTGIRGQRAPATEELYIRGAHHGTATFQAGDNSLRSETTSNIDLALRKTTGAVTWKVNAFHNWIGDYIFSRSADINGDGVADRVDDTGRLDPNGEFLVQNFTQGGARFYGAEAEAIFNIKPEEINLRVFTDYVRGKLDSGGNVPRLTPWRFGLEFDHTHGTMDLEHQRDPGNAPSHMAELESSTPGYTLVNVEMSFRIKETRSEWHKDLSSGTKSPK